MISYFSEKKNDIQHAMISIEKTLDKMVSLTEKEKQLFFDHLEKKEYSAHSIIEEAGKTSQQIYFIETGVLRSYYLENGKEISTYFACDGQVISSFSSFITQQPSIEYIEVITESTVYTLSYKSLHLLFNHSSNFEKLGRMHAEMSYLCTHTRTLSLQTKTAKEKYEEFLTNNDQKIIHNVAQHQIASFLGIAPESLSRIRRELAIC